ncbi:hypothetical protein Dimus_008294, partial [Dionaea muscipula]
AIFISKGQLQQQKPEEEEMAAHGDDRQQHGETKNEIDHLRSCVHECLINGVLVTLRCRLEADQHHRKEKHDGGPRLRVAATTAHMAAAHDIVGNDWWCSSAWWSPRIGDRLQKWRARQRSLATTQAPHAATACLGPPRLRCDSASTPATALAARREHDSGSVPVRETTSTHCK